MRWRRALGILGLAVASVALAFLSDALLLEYSNMLSPGMFFSLLLGFGSRGLAGLGRQWLLILGIDAALYCVMILAGIAVFNVVWRGRNKPN